MTQTNLESEIQRYEQAVCEVGSLARKLRDEVNALKVSTSGLLPGVDCDIIDEIESKEAESRLNQSLADEYQQERSELLFRQNELANKRKSL